MRLTTTFQYAEDRREAERRREAYNEYQRARYQARQEERTAKMRARRAERLAWLEEYLRTQNCAHCNFPTQTETRWHYRDITFDSEDSQRNTAQARNMARQGYSFAKLEAELARLIPLCAECLAKLRPEFVPCPMPSQRQEYERTRYQKNQTASLRTQYMKHRREARKSWIAEQMDRPCEQCGVDGPTVHWHKAHIRDDHEDQDQNTRTLRYLANAGSAYELLRQELDTLFPICDSCYTQWRLAHETLR